MWAYGQNPEQDYLLLYTVLGPSLDSFCLCVGCRIMTNLWIPKRCRRIKQQVSDIKSNPAVPYQTSSDLSPRLGPTNHGSFLS
jgi:hypothetical protein